jgi:hypothetical protein
MPTDHLRTHVEQHVDELAAIAASLAPPVQEPGPIIESEATEIDPREAELRSLSRRPECAMSGIMRRGHRLLP